ncbi:hypothetical protein Agabi119p4_10967 [Agaricus bisporus var. burnettii]|uniref:Glutamine amidotransferase domain-containing protein n=1 Tax=Agaricus bisporus var. burnettii TaxID=192524 RepID=A0A8H7C0X5_AGABI|nr:hypothetical protein Agabi119p4_10967 [Agaricus bisporus var. burnettii]
MPIATLPIPNSVRVALMVCDELPSHSNHGSMFERYRMWLQRSLPPNSKFILKMIAYDVRKQDYPTAEELRKFFDVVVLTASRADAAGQDSWIRRLTCFVQHVHNKSPHIRIYGNGFGHEIIGRALGGVVTDNGRWEYGWKPIKLTEFGKMVFGAKPFGLQQIHRDHVALDTLSDHFSSGSILLLGSTTKTANQGFVKVYQYCEECEFQGRIHGVHQHIHVMTVQGHPELTDSVVTKVVHHLAEEGILKEEAAKKYTGSENAEEPCYENMPRLKWPGDDDGISVVGKAFWKMFGVKYHDDM